jgi:uncharacterized membrane protein
MKRTNLVKLAEYGAAFIADWRTWYPQALLLLGLVLADVAQLRVLHLPLAVAVIAVPGYLVLRLVRFGEWNRPVLRAAVALLCGVAWLLLLGLMAVALLPLIGIDRPLSTTPLIAVYAGSLALLTLWGRRKPFDVPEPKPQPVNAISIYLYGLAILLPVASFVGASLLNNGRSNVVLIGMFGLACLAIVIAVIRSRDIAPSAFPALLFSISLGALWTYSLRSGTVFGWDIQQEFGTFLTTQAAAGWHIGAYRDAHSAMLSITTLPVTIAQLTGLSGAVIFKVVFPMLCSLLPVLLYYAYRQYAKRWVAFAAAVLTVVQTAYLQTFASSARQQLGVLFFALLMFALLYKPLAERPRQWLTVVGICGVVVSHELTAYIALLLLLAVYVGAKLLHYFVRFDADRREVMATSAFVKGWMIVTLFLAALIWYGPVTHANTAASTIFKPSAYSQGAQAVGRFLNHNVVVSLQPVLPVASEPYLNTIGDDYRMQKQFMKYYPFASNAGLESRTPPQIGHDPLLFPLSKGITAVLHYGWWIAALGGAVLLLVGVIRAFDPWRAQLALLVGVAPLVAVLDHSIAGLANWYDPVAMDEQVLLLGALPAILFLVWCCKGVAARFSKRLIAAGLVLAFLVASGLTAQLAGGTPTANLNNFGDDYQRFYASDTDVAAAQWLASSRGAGQPLFADQYADLRLKPYNNTGQNYFPDVTPESVSVGSYVYANHTNIIDDTAYAWADGQLVRYQFPRFFLAVNKDLLYSNGQAEIYR